MFNDLDSLLHSQVRLAIMSILIGVKKAEFSYLLENIKTSKGNLSFQMSKLKEAGYITVQKLSKGNYPLTTSEITEKGIDQYERYIHSIEEYFAEFKQSRGLPRQF